MQEQQVLLSSSEWGSLRFYYLIYLFTCTILFFSQRSRHAYALSSTSRHSWQQRRVLTSTFYNQLCVPRVVIDLSCIAFGLLQPSTSTLCAYASSQGEASHRLQLKSLWLQRWPVSF
jgi:hypothetical protein